MQKVNILVYSLNWLKILKIRFFVEFLEVDMQKDIGVVKFNIPLKNSSPMEKCKYVMFQNGKSHPVEREI